MNDCLVYFFIRFNGSCSFSIRDQIPLRPNPRTAYRPRVRVKGNSDNAKKKTVLKNKTQILKNKVINKEKNMSGNYMRMEFNWVGNDRGWELSV